MGSIWTECNDNDWIAQPLAFDTETPVLVGPMRLVEFGAGADRSVALLLRPHEAAWVNGRPVLAGLKVVDHQAEILIGDQTWYYSAESAPVLVQYQLPQGQRRPRCTLCRMAIEDNQTVIACPQCGRWFHQLGAVGDQPAKQCWTYKDRCLCGHPTSLGGEPVWRPDGEETCA